MTAETQLLAAKMGSVVQEPAKADLWQAAVQAVPSLLLVPSWRAGRADVCAGCGTRSAGSGQDLGCPRSVTLLAFVLSPMFCL